MSRHPSQTPMMKQYRALKEQAGDALLLFRMGDFYELFSDDAERVAPLLDLVLTTRDRDTPNAVPMCGVPVHAIEGYIRKLLQLGHAVAIAEQMEDPKLAKGLVRREIVEVVTPSAIIEVGTAVMSDVVASAAPGINVTVAVSVIATALTEPVIVAVPVVVAEVSVAV